MRSVLTGESTMPWQDYRDGSSVLSFILDTATKAIRQEGYCQGRPGTTAVVTKRCDVIGEMHNRHDPSLCFRSPRMSPLPSGLVTLR